MDTCDSDYCSKCMSKKVMHDRVKGNVKCFHCGFVVESHFQTFEQEVNNYENDPDQMNKMRGLVQEGKDFKIKIGKDTISDQQNKKKRGDEDNNKKTIKLMYKWCEALQFEKRDIYEVEKFYNILLGMDQQKSSAASLTNGGTQANGGQTAVAQKEVGLPILKRRAVISIYTFLKMLKLSDDYNLEQLCEQTCVSLDEAKKELDNIYKTDFIGKEKIIDIIQEKKDLLSIADDYAKQASLSEEDKKGYFSLCMQIKDQITSGEQASTKAAAALYVVFKLSNCPETQSKGLKELHIYSTKSEGTIKKFFDGPICSNIESLLEAMKYQQYNWRHYSELECNKKS